MPQSLALTDLVLPYVVRGYDLADYGPFLSVLRVESFESAITSQGLVIRGRATFQGHFVLDTANLGAKFVNDEDDPPFDPDRRAAVFDIQETHIDFEIFAPRAPSAIISAAAASIAGDDFAPAQAVLDVWDGTPDFPGAGFTLDLILVAPTLRPPGLHPAQATPEGGLVPDPTRQEVAITLPRMRFRLEHGNGTGSQLRASLLSAGVVGLDDPGTIGTAELVSMDPPYAFIGGREERSIGIGFRRAVLDLSDGYTPPDIAGKFGFGDDWAGLFLPEVRFFVAPEGARDLAFTAGVRDLLIGFGPHAGISGDFEAALINQGSGTLSVSARFFDAQGQAHGVQHGGSGQAEAVLPAQTRMVVDAEGGRAPYAVELRVNGGPVATGIAFDINLADAPSAVLQVFVTDSTAGTPLTSTLIITARRRTAPALLPVPRAETPPAQPATVTLPIAADPRIVLVRQTDTDVTLTVEPRESAVLWSVLDGPESNEGPVFTIAVAPSAQRMVQARIAAVDVEPAVNFFFHFEEPHEDRVQTPTEVEDLAGYALGNGNIWTTQANSRLPEDGREAGGMSPVTRHVTLFGDIVPPGSGLHIQGEASFENDVGKLEGNYLLARRRAIATRELLRHHFPDRFAFTIDPGHAVPAADPDLDDWSANWQTHLAGNTGADRQWWRATVMLPDNLSRPERLAEALVERPAETDEPPAPGIVVRDPPPPDRPRPPDWFRSARLKARILRNKLVALEIEGEIDFQTVTEERLAASGELDGAAPPAARSVENGTPVGADNPGDGITRLRLLMQGDDATGRISALVSIGADPADRDGLLAWGPLPGEPTEAEKDFGRTLLGSYLTFWPLLANMPAGNSGRIEETALAGASLALPGVIAALPWFQVERVILYGAEYLVRARAEQTEAYLLFDVQADWSAAIPDPDNFIVRIDPEKPLAVRYKAIGLRLSNREADGSTAPQFSLRPVFDASRGFTIDLVNGGGLGVAEPLGRILRVAGARLSRTNPLTMEIDLALGADLGVVAVDAASFRVFMESPPRFELTALAARVDIPAVLIGKGYLEISAQEIAGQIDLTIRPIGLRVSAALGIASLERPDGSPATGIYAGLELLLPVGIPLGASGLGIFGFRGLFGMHYQRNPDLGVGSAVPALEWLKESGGQPHKIVADNGTRLWTPRFGQWAFGLGIQLGTMEGGFILNLDGTLILELPGPRLLIVMNARFLQPPPGIDEMGQSGILSVIEITPDSLLIGILASYEIPLLVKIVIPVEAFFDYGDTSRWHLYIGRRPDPELGGPPVEVDVLGLVKGTGYLVVKGDGLVKWEDKDLPAVNGFAIGVGAGASFVWGNEDIGLYLRIGGGFDAVIGFEPFILGGNFEVSGELRLFIVSIGARASLNVLVRDTGEELRSRIAGEICGEINLFFFKIKGCVGFDLGQQADPPAVPPLVRKLSLKARSPALAVGTAVDRPVDGSLGDAVEGDVQPEGLPVVPIDSIPVLAMVLPAASANASFLGTPVGDAPSLPSSGFAARGAERYGYRFSSVALQRVNEPGPPVIGTGAPATWWTTGSATGDSSAAQLALLTWEPDPATKALETNEIRREQIAHRWGTICEPAAPPAPVTWTFRFERMGPSAAGWSVEGVAWPDPPGTRRSEAPGTRLDIGERWRSGDPQLDAARGIMGAMVLANPVPCLAATAPAADLVPLLRVGGRGPVVDGEAGGHAGLVLAAADPVLTRLIRADGKQPFRVSTRLVDKAETAPTAAAISLATLLNRLQNGQAIGHDEAQALLAGGGASQTTFPPQPGCRGRVLVAPRLDDGRAVALGDLDRAEEIAAALAAARVTHGPLDDVVVLRTGPVAEITLLLFAARADILEGRVVARLLNAAGAELSRVVALGADMVPPQALPARWTDTAGPWSEDVADALAFRTGDAALAASHFPVLLNLAGTARTDRIEIGLLPVSADPPAPTDLPRPPWYLAVVECLSFAEMERHDWDTAAIGRERETITSYLGPDSTDNALLHPNSVYRVAVAWQGEREADGTSGSGTQSFWFRTDAVAPARLDPWLLTTWPDEREAKVFGGEPLRIVFNTHDVDRLYAAYGRELRLRLQAASAHVPQAPDGPSLPLSISGAAGTLLPAGASVLAPFEAMLVDLLQGQCIPIDEGRARQSQVIVQIPLDPYADYILDIVSVPAGAAATEAGERVLRRQFSTGGYRTPGEFAARLIGVEVGHAAITPGTLAAALAPFAGRQPQGGEFDAALRAMGLDALPAATRPGSTVLWQQAGNGTPQPVAVLVDADEPLWRSRAHPRDEPDADGLPGTRRWRMTQEEWLALEQGAGGTASLGPAGVVRAPGGQRALVVLGSAQRGRRLRLDLVRQAFPEPFLNLPEERHRVFDLRLDRAPWEE